MYNVESLNSIIKTECLYCRFGKSNVKNHKVPKKDVIAAVVEFIEYYNTTRPKESLGFMSPVENSGSGIPKAHTLLLSPRGKIDTSLQRSGSCT
ncbi:MAG: IS3 family transposase [Sphaerochaetaceae bacterium]